MEERRPPHRSAARDIVLSYNAAHLRVRLELSVHACRSQEQPPEDLLERAQKKMMAERDAGKVALYQVKKETLIRVWQSLRIHAALLTDDYRVQFTLAEGTPPLPGFTVTKSTNPNCPCLVSFPPRPKLVRKWRLKWLLTATKIQLQHLGVKGAPHRAALRALRNRVVSGEKISRVALPFEPKVPKDCQDADIKPYTFKLSASKCEVTLVLQRPLPDRSAFPADQVLRDLKACVARLQLPPFKILEKSLIADMNLINTGYERLGIGLPATILAAQRFGKPQSKGSPIKIPAHYPGKGLLPIQVSKDGMLAEVKGFELENYKNEEVTFDAKWLRFECANAGLPPLEKQYLERALDRFTRKKDPNNLVLATGVDGSAPADPRLAPIEPSAPTKESKIDVRASRIPNIVESGMRIATVEYQQEGKPRIDVYGKDHETPEPEPFAVDLGEGTERRGDDFFATQGGLRVMTKDAIKVSQTYVHKGDINLRSGNVIFDGNVQIKGNLDAGVRVETTGNLHVTGNIAAASVRVQGDLVVQGGINTGHRSEVHCAGAMQIGFAENAILYCQNSITIEKSLLNSTVYCDGVVTCNGGQSLVAGGHLHVFDRIQTRNLGFEGSIDTHVIVGEDWRGRRRLEARDARTERLKALLEEERLQLRELSRRGAAQLTSRHKRIKDNLGNRIIRLKRLIEKAGVAADKVAATLDYNEDTVVEVLGTMSPQVTFYFKDRFYRPPASLQASVFTPYLSQDSKFLSIDDFQELLAAKQRKLAG